MALEKLVEIVDACMGEEGLTYSIDDSQIGIATGELAMAFTWASRAAAHGRSRLLRLRRRHRISRPPLERLRADGLYAATGGTGAGLGIPANIDDDPDLVFQVILEAMDEESQLLRAIQLRRDHAPGGGGKSRCSLSAGCLRHYQRRRRRHACTRYRRRVEPGLGSVAAADHPGRNVRSRIAGRRRRRLHDRSDRPGLHRGLVR